MLGTDRIACFRDWSKSQRREIEKSDHIKMGEMAADLPPVTMKSEEKEIADLDDVLQHVGEMGKYQYIIFTMLGLTVFAAGFPVLIMFFGSLNPPWTCVEGSAHCTLNGSFTAGDEGYRKRCSMPRSAWQFTKPRTYSIVTQFDIYCDREYFIYLSSTLLFVGWAVGSTFYGWLTDSYGRSKVLFGSLAGVILFNFLSAFSPSIEVFSSARFMIGLFYPATMVGPAVLLGEMVGPKYRPWTAAVTGVAFSISLLMTGLKAYFIREWKILIISCSAPYSLVLLFYFYVPESIRWLRLHGYHAKVIDVLRKAARVNGNVLPDNLQLPPLPDADVIKTRGSVLDLFRPLKMFALTSVLAYVWFATAAVYYGISLGVGELTGEMYRDYVLVTAIEIPAVIGSVFFMKRPGRKITMVVGLVLSGIFCSITGGLVSQKDLKAFRLLFGLLGKACITIAFNTVYLWSVELYPTSIRGEGMSLMQITARIGSAMAPWLAKWLGVFHIAIPFSLMGVISLAAGIVCMALPETRDIHTLETTNEILGVGVKKLGNSLLLENKCAKV